MKVHRMADYKVGYGKPPESAKWKPGQTGNPLGAKTHDPDLKAVKNLTKKELVEIGNLIIKNDVATLRALAETETISTLKRMIVSVALRVIQNGDMAAFDVLLNRLVGKVKDEIHHQGDINAPQIIVTMPDNGRSAKAVTLPMQKALDIEVVEDDYGF